MAAYSNPWHVPGKPEYGPATYVTDAVSAPYRGFEIYDRLPNVFDVVKDGACVGQFAGYGGAVRNIDAYLGGEEVCYLTVQENDRGQDSPALSPFQRI